MHCLLTEMKHGGTYRNFFSFYVLLWVVVRMSNLSVTRFFIYLFQNAWHVYYTSLDYVPRSRPAQGAGLHL